MANESIANESIARSRETQNVVFGAGEIHIDPYDDNGNLTGERYLGSTPGFSLQIQTERTQAFDDDGPAAVKIVDFVRQIDRSFSFQCKDISDENLALFISGTALAGVAVPTAAVVDEPVGGEAISGKVAQHDVSAAIGVKQGRSYILGNDVQWVDGAGDKIRDPLLGIMHRPGSITLHENESSPNPASFTESGSDSPDGAFRIDDRGRLYIEQKAGDLAVTIIPDGTKLLVDYTPVANMRINRVVPGDKQIRAAIHYIEYPAAGKRRDFYAVNCNIGASGEFAVKSRENPQTMSFEAAIQEPTQPGIPSLVIASIEKTA